MREEVHNGQQHYSCDNSAVGMLGVLSVRDDGTCQVGSYCNVTDNGIATATKDKTGYRIVRRISDNVVEVVFR